MEEIKQAFQITQNTTVEVYLQRHWKLLSPTATNGENGSNTHIFFNF